MELHSKQLYAEAYSRRENLNFFGIPERKEENGGDTQKACMISLRTSSTLMILLTTSSFNEFIVLVRRIRIIREKVLRAGFKINKNTNFKVLEDYPQEIITRRRAQMSKLMEAKKKGKKVSFSKKEPDKLCIDGVYVPA